MTEFTMSLEITCNIGEANLHTVEKNRRHLHNEGENKSMQMGVKTEASDLHAEDDKKISVMEIVEQDKTSPDLKSCGNNEEDDERESRMQSEHVVSGRKPVEGVDKPAQEDFTDPCSCFDDTDNGPSRFDKGINNGNREKGRVSVLNVSIKDGLKVKFTKVRGGWLPSVSFYYSYLNSWTLFQRGRGFYVSAVQVF